MLIKDERSLEVVREFYEYLSNKSLDPNTQRDKNKLQCLINKALEEQHKITKNECVKAAFNKTLDTNLAADMLNIKNI